MLKVGSKVTIKNAIKTTHKFGAEVFNGAGYVSLKTDTAIVTNIDMIDEGIQGLIMADVIFVNELGVEEKKNFPFFPHEVEEGVESLRGANGIHVGDMVKVIMDGVSVFKVGDVVKVHEYNEGSWFPFVCINEKGTTQVFDRTQLKKVEVEMKKFKIGDKVKLVAKNSSFGLMDYMGGFDKVGAIGVVSDINLLSRDRVEVQLNEYFGSGLTFHVNCLQLLSEDEGDEMKVGTIVKMKKELFGHGFEIGEICKIIYVRSTSSDFEAESLTSGDRWFITEKEFEVIDEDGENFSLETDLDERPKAEIGNVLQIIDNDLSDYGSHYYENGEYVVVLDINSNGDYRVERVGDDSDWGQTVCPEEVIIAFNDVDDYDEFFDEDYKDDDYDDEDDYDEDYDDEDDEEFPIGSIVKVIDNVDSSYSSHNFEIGALAKVIGYNNYYCFAYELELLEDTLGTSQWLVPEEVELYVPEPEKIEKPQEFKVGDIVVPILKSNETYRLTNDRNKAVCQVIDTLADNRIIVKVLEINKDMREALGVEYIVETRFFILRDKKNTPSTQVFKFGDVKVVFNGDFTVVTDGKKTGKAKKHEDDEYNALIGLQVAYDRFNSKDVKDLKNGDKIKVLGVSNESPYGRHCFDKGSIVTFKRLAYDLRGVVATDGCDSQTLIDGEYEIL